VISPIVLADSTGLGPLIGFIIILSLMGVLYKIAGTMGAVVIGILSAFILTFIGMLPLWLGAGIGFAIIVGVLYKSGGEKDAY